MDLFKIRCKCFDKCRCRIKLKEYTIFNYIRMTFHSPIVDKFPFKFFLHKSLTISILFKMMYSMAQLYMNPSKGLNPWPVVFYIDLVRRSLKIMFLECTSNYFINKVCFVLLVTAYRTHPVYTNKHITSLFLRR